MFFFSLEVLDAPNITSKWCNQSYSFMRWQVRSHLNDDFKYELQIQKVSGFLGGHLLYSYIPLDSGALGVGETFKTKKTEKL